jgi:flagellar biogenesis protein FliO
MSGETERQESGWTVETLRSMLIKMNEERDLRYQQRFQGQLDAVMAALAAAKEAVNKAETANEKRFESVNEFRSTLSDQAAQFLTRSEHSLVVGNLQKELDTVSERTDAKFQAEIKPMMARLDQLGRPNWALMASIASVFLVIVSGIWLVIGLKIETSTTPLEIEQQTMQTEHNQTSERLRQLENLTSGSAGADVQSRTDRDQLNNRVRQLEANLASSSTEARGQIQTVNAKLIEIETQFCASDIVRNLMHAQDSRTIAILWHKAFPETTMPTDNTFYPRICNRADPSQ